MELYLVVNTQDETEKWCLDICNSPEVAESLREKYIKNFLQNTHHKLEYVTEFIQIECINTESDDNGVIWNYDRV